VARSETSDWRHEQWHRFTLSNCRVTSDGAIDVLLHFQERDVPHLEILFSLLSPAGRVKNHEFELGVVYRIYGN